MHENLNVIEVKKDGQHQRCETCKDILLDCTQNHLFAINLNFLQKIRNNVHLGDPMYFFYHGLDPEQLPTTICPNCENTGENRQVI